MSDQQLGRQDGRRTTDGNFTLDLTCFIRSYTINVPFPKPEVQFLKARGTQKHGQKLLVLVFDNSASLLNSVHNFKWNIPARNISRGQEKLQAVGGPGDNCFPFPFSSGMRFAISCRERVRLDNSISCVDSNPLHLARQDIMFCVCLWNQTGTRRLEKGRGRGETD